MNGEREGGADACAPPARGRPRDATRDTVILDATLALLVDVGYDQLSVEAVAARARVGKATIYRRYPNKAALVVAAVDQRAAWAPPTAPPDDLRDALMATVGSLARGISEQDLALLGTLFVGMRNDPALATAMRRVLARDQAAMTEGFLGRGADVGDGGGHRKPQAAELVSEVATAVIVHRVVIVGQACDEPFLEHLVDDILVPLLRQPSRTS